MGHEVAPQGGTSGATSPAPPRILPMGDRALLVEPLAPDRGGSARAVLDLHAALEASRPPGVVDLVPAHATVLVTFDRRVTRPADVAAWVRGTRPAETGAAKGDLLELDVRDDGEDLAEVGRLTGLGTDGVVAAHTEATWTVAFSGFAPGFGYLLPPDGDGRLDVPRRSTPRVRVPAGSVALAAGYTGVYPRPSPGGWQIIGTTSAALWDTGRQPPALLRPGVRVAFRAVTGP